MFDDTPTHVFLEGIFLKDCRDSTSSLYADIDGSLPAGSDAYESIEDDVIVDTPTLHEPVTIEAAIRAEGIDIENRQITEEHYEKLPMFFINRKSWPHTTPMKCWFCHLTFGGTPVPLPLIAERNIIEDATMCEEVLQFKVHGVFCSFNCCAAYIDNCIDICLQNHISARRAELQNLLILLYKKFIGDDIDHIPRSPPPQVMIQYGGERTEESYRTIVAELTNSYRRSAYDSSIDRVRLS